MDQCKHDGCGSYAINDHKESGLCDKCYWIEQAEKLTTERDKLKSYLLESKNALEDANGLYFSTYTTESQSPYDILINKLGKLL